MNTNDMPRQTFATGPDSACPPAEPAALAQHDAEVQRLQGLVDYYEYKYNEAHDVAPAKPWERIGDQT